jgi:phosphoenolpyruvate synthase/pyruvate phosphate dikinase
MTKNVPTSKAERGAYVLSDEEILDLARMAKTIEKHYGLPMDMEWAKDGRPGSSSSCRPGPKRCSRAKMPCAQILHVKKPAPRPC